MAFCNTRAPAALYNFKVAAPLILVAVIKTFPEEGIGNTLIPTTEVIPETVTAADVPLHPLTSTTETV